MTKNAADLRAVDSVALDDEDQVLDTTIGIRTLGCRERSDAIDADATI